MAFNRGRWLRGAAVRSVANACVVAKRASRTTRHASKQRVTGAATKGFRRNNASASADKRALAIGLHAASKAGGKDNGGKDRENTHRARPPRRVFIAAKFTKAGWIEKPIRRDFWRSARLRAGRIPGREKDSLTPAGSGCMKGEG